MRNYYDIPLWKDVDFSQWSDWQWQIHNGITTLEDLEQVISLTNEERKGIITATKCFKMKISPHIVSLMDVNDTRDSLRRQFVPSIKELESVENKELYDDVNADDRFSPIKGLVHRYPSKVLVFPSNYCGSYCRYCFRRKLNRDVEEAMEKCDLESVFKYINDNPQIEEVILSGGDALVLKDEEIEFILRSLSKIQHIQIVRIHTRIPVTIPYRITNDFILLLSQFKHKFPIFIVVHIDTLVELSEPTRQVLTKLIDNGILCFASCPLLKGINDSEETLRNLWTELVKIRIKPYYLFQSDPVKGLQHFLVPISRGLDIMKNLYDRMSGLAMPLYCFNVPDGGGHILLNYNYISKISEGSYLISNFEGQQSVYTENI